jgi:Family of unknown function (DUF5362)
MMFIGAGFMLLAAAGMLLVGGLGAMDAKGTASAIPAAAGVGIAIVYAAMAIVYIFPAMKLWKYASGIGRLIFSASDDDLIRALNEQRSFWKFVGILMIGLLALYMIGMIVMVIFAVGIGSALPHLGK